MLMKQRELSSLSRVSFSCRLIHRKKIRQGKAERRALIDKECGATAANTILAAYLRRDVATDDIYDAFAAALWTARRMLRGLAVGDPQPATAGPGRASHGDLW